MSASFVMTLFQSYSKVTLGFSIILAMLLMIMGLWIKDTRSNAHRIEHVTKLQLRSNHVSVMRDVALERTISLHRMADIQDPFSRDDEYMHYRAIAADFLRAREALASNNEHESLESPLWNKLKPLMNEGGAIQNKVAGLIMDEEIVAANRILIEDLWPVQNRVIQTLNDLLAIQKNHIEEELRQTVTHRADTYLLIALLGTITLMFTLFMFYVLRSNGKAEREFLNQSKKIRELYEVSSRPGSTVQEKILQILRMGCEFMNLDAAYVCSVSGDVEDCATIFSYVNPGVRIDRRFQEQVLDKYHRITIWRKDLLALHNLSRDSSTDIPQHDGALIAICIDVNTDVFGTVSFVSMQAREQAFNDKEQDLVRLIASWVSMSLERLSKEQELEEARDISEAASRVKSSFLANMSHELRTPLNAIIGYSEMLTEMSTEDRGEEFLEDLRKITNSGRHLLGLINDILDISKIEAGKVELSMANVDINEMLDEVCSTVTPGIIKNHNHFKVYWDRELSLIYCDVVRVRQILINLLSNAGKFCRDGQVTLRVTVDESKKQRNLVFRIEDTGIGIETDKINRLFKPFSQLINDVSGEFGGTGLGLVISKRLANLMDGDIKVDSAPGKLTTFTFWIPAVTGRQSVQQHINTQSN